MKCIAKVSFSGNGISLYEGQEVDIDPSLVSDYIKCGYLEEVKRKGKDENESKRNNGK